MPRKAYNKTHKSYQIGRISRLKNLSCMYIPAGSSIGVNAEFLVRLSPLRRALTADAQITCAAFLVPLRHIYDNWEDFILAGPNENVTFPGVANTSTNKHHSVYAAGRMDGVAQIPRWIVDSYAMIWNRFYRAPTFPEDALSLGTLLPDDISQSFGVRCARLRTPWSTGIKPGTINERAVPGPVSGGFDLVDLGRQQAEYSRYQDQRYYGQRYHDWMKKRFGGGASIDADQRPVLLNVSRSWMSGADVNGTADANLGRWSGKSYSTVRFGFPMRHVPEHSVIVLNMLVRFPPTNENEMDYLHKKANPTYLEFAGDPGLIAKEPPHSFQIRDWFNSLSTGTLNERPYAEWMRYKASVVHELFDAREGFPFESTVPANAKQARYDYEDWNDMFSDLEFHHWQAMGTVKVLELALTPVPEVSIGAGA